MCFFSSSTRNKRGGRQFFFLPSLPVTVNVLEYQIDVCSVVYIFSLFLSSPLSQPLSFSLCFVPCCVSPHRPRPNQTNWLIECNEVKITREMREGNHLCIDATRWMCFIIDPFSSLVIHFQNIIGFQWPHLDKKWICSNLFHPVLPWGHIFFP